MLELWPLLLGWPAVVIAIALSVTGIVQKKSRWLVAAAIVALPLALYLAGSPAFGWLGLTIPLFLPAASIAIHYDNSRLAWFLLAPFVGVSGWLALAVINQ